MGGAEALLPDDQALFQGNPAAGADVRGATLGTSYTCLYGLGDLPLAILAFAQSLGGTTLRLTARNLETPGYQERSGAVSASRRMHERLGIGAALRWMRLDLGEYGSAQALGADIGFAGRPRSDLALGVSLRNLNHPLLGACGDEVPSTFCLGLTFRPQERLVICGNLRHDVNCPVELRLGEEYWVLNSLALRFGLSAQPSVFACGAGYHGRWLQFDYALRSHPRLGATHQVSCSFFRDHEQRRGSVADSARVSPEPLDSVVSRPDLLDINSANLEELDLLPGMSMGTAQEIVRYRREHGPFGSIDDLDNVPGIGPGTIKRIRELVFVRETDQRPPAGSEKLDLNQATAQDLERLPGIGKKTAERIVAYRVENGPFKQLEDLLAISGVGRRTLEELRQLVVVR
jgi:competence protein ComEA